MLLIFLSTPSARRATPEPLRLRLHHQISIHALREEGDRVRRRIGSVLANFYPRPPRGGRHAHSLILPSLSDFYPRPPRGGRLSQMFLQCRLRNFYPRPPRGGRPTGRKARNINKLFLSTPSASLLGHFCISIHALREEGDRHGPAAHRGGADFYPRPPRGGRLPAVDDALHIPVISIHALREEGDLPRLPEKPYMEISIHALREEGDEESAGYINAIIQFLSTPSARRATAFDRVLSRPKGFLSTPSARRATISRCL